VAKHIQILCHNRLLSAGALPVVFHLYTRPASIDKVLFTESVHTADATRCGAKLSLAIPQLQWVLLHVQPALSQYLKEEARLKPSARIALQKPLCRQRFAQPAAYSVSPLSQ
jgi:hypothetical protein